MAFVVAKNVPVSKTVTRQTNTIVLKASANNAEFWRETSIAFSDGKVDVNPDHEPLVISSADFPQLLEQWDNLPQYHPIFRSKAELGQAMAGALRVLAFMGDAADMRKIDNATQ